MTHASEKKLGNIASPLAAEDDEGGLVLLSGAHDFAKGRSVPDVEYDINIPLGTELCSQHRQPLLVYTIEFLKLG
jgi:hypothetical protein